MHILEKIKDEVIQHANEEYPNECCGLAVIVKGKIKYIKCKNVLSGNKFLISTEDYAFAEDLGEIVGVCHSHINEPAIPSDCDKVGIENTKVPWLIVNPKTSEFTITEPIGFKLPLIGREFKHGIVDCLTLIRDYYADIGIILPDSVREDDWWLKGQDLYREQFASYGFVKVGGSEFTGIKKHDVLLMQVASPVPNHGAVYIGDNMILQHCQGRISSRDVYGGYWRKVTNIVLRHKELL